MYSSQPDPAKETLMNPDEKAQMLERANRYSFWAKLHLISFSLRKIEKPLSIACVVLGLVNIATLFMDGKASNPTLGSIVILGMMVGFGIHKAEDYTEKKKNEYSDTRMKPREYDLLLASVRSVGINAPERYVIEHPANVNAYIKVLDAARFSIKIPDTFRAKHNPISDVLEEHRVAALVLPGPEVARRSEMIISLIEDRKVDRYEDIKALVEQHDKKSLPLLEGTL